MKRRRTRMAFDGDILQAVDWADLGRRIRSAAAEAVQLNLPLPTHVRGKPSPMRHGSTEETGVDREGWGAPK